MTTSGINWNNKTGGTQTSVTNSSTNATRYYYSESKPTLNTDGTAYDGNYWRYVDSVVTPWVYTKPEE